MGDKWSRPRSLGEILNQSLDSTYRILKTGVYGWTGSTMAQIKVDSDGQIYVANPAGEQYADGTSVNAGYKGNLVLGTDGSNYQILAVDSSGHLQVDVVSGGGTGGTSMADDAAFTVATTSFTPVGGQTTADAVNAGDAGAFLMDTDRHQQIDIVDISKGTQTNDVKITLDGETVTVSATDLDIRDLSSATDSIAIEGGNTTDVKVTLDSEVVAVSATDLDIRDLSSATDSVAVEGGNATDVKVTLDGETVGVSATDLDIRDLSSATDSVAIEGGNTTDVKVTLDSEAVVLDSPTDGTYIGDIKFGEALPSGSNTIGSVQLTDGVETASVNASNQLEVAVGNTVNVADGGSSLSVDDGGGSLTVDGSVTVSATNLDIRDLSSATDSVAVEGGNSTDVKVTLDGETVGVSATDLDVRDLAATQDTVTAKLATDAIQNGTTALTPKFAKIDVASSGDNTIVAAVSGKKIRVLQYALVCGAETTVQWYSGAAGTALSGDMQFIANGGISSSFSPVGLFETASNTALVLNLSAANAVSGHLVYVEV